jgi:hypothetical protein
MSAPMPRRAKAQQERSGREATRPILEVPPKDEDGASAEEAYIDARRRGIG